MVKDTITYNDFAELDIRIGEIKTVEVVETADRLLRLTVDVGETDAAGNAKHRQIVSGIRTFFSDPQVLIGKRCPFLINIETRVIKGIESQGMILAGKNGDTFALLIPHRELPPGTAIL